MSEGVDDIQLAVREWKDKHDIEDDDPMFALMELLEIFFRNAKVEVPNNCDVKAIEVRAELQQIDRLAKDFCRQARELKQEIRGISKLKRRLAAGRVSAILITAVSALVAGILIGKFLL